MEIKPYSFIHIPHRECKALKDKEINDCLIKWSMKGNLQVQYYNFNQPFQVHKKQEFVECFFSDPVVFSSLTYNQEVIGKSASSVSYEHIPCTILSMEFFDRLLDPENGVVRCDSKTIVQCHGDNMGEFFIDDNLRNVILNEDSEYYNIFSESDRKQFLWKIFCHLCLGGEWCQYEFSIEQYLNTAKLLYKDVISVERIGETAELVIRSIVLKVQVFDEDNKPLLPTKPNNIQNFVYLIIDPFKRSVAVLSHSYSGNVSFH